MKSILRFDSNGIAYAAVATNGSFGDNTAFCFQVVGRYCPRAIRRVMEEILTARNKNHLDAKEGEHHYFSKFTEQVGDLEFNYLGSGNMTIVVNKCRVLFHGEANILKDFTKKVEKVSNALAWELEKQRECDT